MTLLWPAISARASVPSRRAAPLPPRGFLPLEDVKQVYLTKCPHPHRGKMTEAQRAGLRFEAKAKEFLSTKYDASRLILGQWFYASDGRNRRYLQPDVLIFSDPVSERPNCITIVEIKTSWSPLAWWQLRKLYSPAIRKFYSPGAVRLVAFVRSFDPFVESPEKPTLMEDIHMPLFTDEVGVFQWK